MPPEPQPCGTPAAYKRHGRAGEEPCDPCKKAHTRRIARTNRIWLRTLQALAHRYPEEYAEIRIEQAAIYDQEQAAKAERARKDAEWAATFAEFEETPDA